MPDIRIAPPVAPQAHNDAQSILTLLSNALTTQNNTTQSGFDRLEAVALSAQRDMRMFTLILLFALLVSAGVGVSAKWGTAALGLTPAYAVSAGQTNGTGEAP